MFQSFIWNNIIPNLWVVTGLQSMVSFTLHVMTGVLPYKVKLLNHILTILFSSFQISEFSGNLNTSTGDIGSLGSVSGGFGVGGKREI